MFEMTGENHLGAARVNFKVILAGFPVRGK